MTAILGISAFYHDSAAALLVDGEIVAAAQEERFTRNKHDHAFPVKAIEYCLGHAGLDPSQLDYVGFYDKPLLKFERLLETYLAYAPRGFRSFLDGVGAKYRVFEDDDGLCGFVAEQLADEKVAGWMQGRMEFGPRALGSRSIIGDARSEKMQQVMNLKIKFRESFRPFAPSVLQDRVDEFFQMRPNESSPYMLLVAPVQDEKRADGNGQMDGLEGIDKLKVKRSDVPAVTHVDYSARVQTVDEARHGRYHRLIKAFEAKTGCPVIINTSFNVRGEPIVCTPEHAYRCFMATNMDVLVIERFVLLKEEQPDAQPHEVDEYLAQFQLD